MKFTVLTLFPEVFATYLSQTIIQRAADLGMIRYDIVNIRDYARNKHGQMDDVPFGGGAGMVLKPEAYWNFFNDNYKKAYRAGVEKEKISVPYVIFVSPQGIPLNHEKVLELSEKEEIPLKKVL